MSTKRQNARRRCQASASKNISPELPVTVIESYPGELFAIDGDIIPLEFGVVEVKSEIEEIVITSQGGDLTSLFGVSQAEQDDSAGQKSLTFHESSMKNTTQPDTEITLINDRYTCDICPKQFGRQAALKKHMESHKSQETERRRRGRQPTVKLETSLKSISNEGTGKFECSDCKKTFSNMVTLKQHVVTHNTTKSHVCQTCNKPFGSRSHLEEHVRTHTGEKPFLCCLCNKGFASPSNLRKHLRFHNRRMPYVCSFCLQSYGSNDLLEAHLRVHKGYVCPECKEVVISRIDLEHHRYKHGVRNDLRCTSCLVEFPELSALRTHHLNDHGDVPDVLVCNECKSSYRYPSELRQHMATHVSRITPGTDEPVSICLSEDLIDDLVKSKRAKATKQVAAETFQNNGSDIHDASDESKSVQELKPSVDKDKSGNCPSEGNSLCASDSTQDLQSSNTSENVCDVCQVKCNSLSDLMSHRVSAHDTALLNSKRMSSSNKSKFICLYCSKSFSKRYCLEQHERVHSNERPFSCETCGLTFKQQSQLLKHNVKHTGEKPFRCSYCGKAFSQASYLNEHKRQHTDERPYGCETCGNRFRTNGALRVHKRLHTGAMPYSCDVCNRRFKQKANLLKHRQIHTNVRSHNCQLCDKGFTDSQALKRHMVMHTGERPHLCLTCGKKFPARSSLTIHMKFHRGDRAHKCNFCGKGFVVKSHLNRHLQTHIKKDMGIILGQEDIASNYIPIDDDLGIGDTFQIEEVVQTS